MEEYILIIVAGLIFAFAILFFLTIRSLKPVFLYAYPNARLTAMEARLLPKARIKEIAMQKSCPKVKVIEALSSTDYSLIKDIDAKNCEMRFSEYFVSHLYEVRKFVPKTASPVLEYYMREWEIQNILNSLRIVANNIAFDKEDIQYNFVDTDKFGRTAVQNIISSKDITEALEKLKGTAYWQTISDHLSKYPGDRNLGILESMLVSYSLMKLHDDAAGTDIRMTHTDKIIIKDYVGVKADILNIVTAIRSCLRKAADSDCRQHEMVQAGLFITPEKRESLCKSGTLDDIESIVSKTLYEEAFHEGLNEFKKTGKIDGFEERLNSCMTDYTKDLAIRYPFSIAALIGYATLKRREVFLLRSIAKGISTNVSLDIGDLGRISYAE